MPYIKLDDRDDYNSALVELIALLGENSFDSGHVNFVLTRILHEWWLSASCYKTICLIMGTCSAVAQEFYRRVATPYEDKKNRENGDVYLE